MYKTNPKLHGYINDPICESHAHLCFEKSIDETVECYEKIIKHFNYKAVNLNAVPVSYGMTENYQVIYCKSRLAPMVYACAGPHLYSSQKDTPEALLEQIKEYDKMGFDGIKMLDGKVSQYRITGSDEARQTALDAAKYFFSTGYSREGKFIIRAHPWWNEGPGCRTMMDSLLNAPFLMWAGKELGDEEMFQAGVDHNLTTEKYLIRDDASSFHHYQFDVETHAPLYGLTWQGYSDDSCWSRGHSWAVYGYPIAYSYCKEEYMIQVHKDITYYMLNQLGDDLIPQWDFIFKPEEDQPRDSSAGAVFVCGMHEMCKYLPDDAPQKAIFESAAAQMLEAIIDKCTGDIGVDYDGLICHVTHALPQGAGIDECAIYGDYFYLEALMRYKNPEWNRYW